jgi:hypothetical protein
MLAGERERIIEKAETHDEKLELLAILKEIVRKARSQITEYRASLRQNRFSLRSNRDDVIRFSRDRDVNRY